MGLLDDNVVRTVATDLLVKFTDRDRTQRLNDVGASYAYEILPSGVLILATTTAEGTRRRRYSPSAWDWIEEFVPAYQQGVGGTAVAIGPSASSGIFPEAYTTSTKSR